MKKIELFSLVLSRGVGLLALWGCGLAQAASPVINEIGIVPRLTIQSDVNAVNQIEYRTNISDTNWVVLTNVVVTESPYSLVDPATALSPQRFYRVVASPLPDGMALIPAGSFNMGDSLDHDSTALPVHSVSVGAFFMDKTMITYSHWQQVYSWATNHGYAFDNAGMGKAANHPVHTVNWYDAVKWCNARSEMEGLIPCYYSSVAQTSVYRSGLIDLGSPLVKWSATGYRLPTEAEWEKAARGGVNGFRFPWTDVDSINPSRANYYADPSSQTYDQSLTTGNDPAFGGGSEPFTSPVGFYSPNGFGLYDMAGNLYKWCWDVYGNYSAAAQTDPKGPSSGSDRIARGGTWCCGTTFSADGCRVAYRGHGLAPNSGDGLGFQCVRAAGN